MIDTSDITPVTYINSAASLKAFCGKHGGIVCTSSNAKAVLEWAFKRTKRVLFFPDQHLGRNTAFAMGVPLEQMPVWNPLADELGGNTEDALRASKVLLWQGHCSVHAIFRPSTSINFAPSTRASRCWCIPSVPRGGGQGRHLRLDGQDHPRGRGRTAGTKWAIGTELHLVNRLKQEHPEQEIHFLSPIVCMCATMYRINLAHLCWSLENLEAGTR